jgi:hypothetical protein
MSYFQMHKTMYCYYNNKTNFPVICSNIPIKDIKLQWEMCSKSSLQQNDLVKASVSNYATSYQIHLSSSPGPPNTFTVKSCTLLFLTS